MNIGIPLATIFSLVLALAAAGGAKDQGDSHSTMAIRGKNLNHNETLVRDAAPIQHEDTLALWLSNELAFRATLFMQLSIYRAGISPGTPVVLGTNLNHNETLVRDAAPAE